MIRRPKVNCSSMSGGISAVYPPRSPRIHQVAGNHGYVRDSNEQVLDIVGDMLNSIKPLADHGEVG